MSGRWPGRAAEERGWALVTAIIVMGLMLSIGLAGFSYVDQQQRQSRTERVREASFNLAEGAMGAQTFALSRQWPTSAVTDLPRFCTDAGPVPSTHPRANRCPSTADVAASFAAGDYEMGSDWVVSVRDNQGASATTYDPAGDDDLTTGDGDDDVSNEADDAGDGGTDAMPTWDQGGAAGTAVPDGRVWVRAQGIVSGRRRTVVALVRIESLSERFPRNAVTAGRFATTNASTNKLIIDLSQAVGSSAGLAVRCSTATTGCLDYDATQIDPPDRVYTNYGDSGEALSDAALDRLRQTAIANGTYHADCSTVSDPAGPLVFIETGGTGCRITNAAGSVVNSPEAPGMIVVANGTLELAGNLTYHGVIYAANRTGLTGTVVTVNGTVAVKGAIAVDGAGGLLVGSSGNVGSSEANVVYDPNAFAALRSYGASAFVPSSWREIEG